MKKIILAITVLISTGILSVFFVVSSTNGQTYPALHLSGETVIGLDWQNFDIPDLAMVRALSDDLLSYDLQVKVMIDQDRSEEEHYIAGLSFRFDSGSEGSTYLDDYNFYGISFFRSSNTGVKLCHKPGTPAEKNLTISPCAWEAHLNHGDTLGPCGGSTTTLPTWLSTLNSSSSFDPVLNGKPYLVLWLKDGDSFTLLGYKELGVADGVVEIGGGEDEEDKCSGNSTTFSEELSIKDWSTIMVRVEDVKVGDGEDRKNKITAYIQGTDGLARNTTSWNEEIFEKVDWNVPGTEGTIQIIENDTLTSGIFKTKKPVELGIHGFHTSPTQDGDDQYFCDIDVKLANIIEMKQQ